MHNGPLRTWLRVDATHERGLGHAVRLSGLLEHLGVPLACTVFGRGEALPRMFPGARVIAPDPSPEASLAAAAGHGAPDLFLWDCPEPEPAVWTALDALPATLRVAVDDYGGAFPVDLAINGSVLPEHHAYADLRPGGEALCGASYALIRDAFRAVRGRAAAGEPGERLTVVIGSGERAQRWAFALAEDGIDRNTWHDVTLVVGAAFPESAALSDAAACHGIDVCQGLDAGALAARLARSSHALITGGMILYECLAAGVPTVAYPQEPNLIAEVRFFGERGCCVDLGHAHGGDPARARAELAALRAERERSLVMASRATALVDGVGLERAARAVCARLSPARRENLAAAG